MGVLSVKRSQEAVRLTLFEVLNGMFVKKRAGLIGVTAQEEECLRRIENSKLLRSLVDYRIPFRFPEGYVPPQMEIELCGAAITRNPPERGADFKKILALIMAQLVE